MRIDLIAQLNDGTRDHVTAATALHGLDAEDFRSLTLTDGQSLMQSTRPGERPHEAPRPPALAVATFMTAAATHTLVLTFADARARRRSIVFPAGQWPTIEVVETPTRTT